LIECMFRVIWGSYNRPDYTANSFDEINNYMDLKVLPIIFCKYLKLKICLQNCISDHK
jgi:hypothetical protein